MKSVEPQNFVNVYFIFLKIFTQYKNFLIARLIKKKCLQEYITFSIMEYLLKVSL